MTVNTPPAFIYNISLFRLAGDVGKPRKRGKGGCCGVRFLRPVLNSF